MKLSETGISTAYGRHRRSCVPPGQPRKVHGDVEARRRASNTLSPRMGEVCCVSSTERNWALLTERSRPALRVRADGPEPGAPQVRGRRGV